MNFIQAFQMAIKSILNNKMRSFLTMLGIIIGVASVITLVSVLQGMQKQVMLDYQKMGVNKINVNYNSQSLDLSQPLYDYCNSLSGEVLGVTPNATSNLKLRYRNKNWNTTVYFGNDKFDTCLNFSLQNGRGISYSDVFNRVRVCVIGTTIKKQFFGLENPIGKTIKISGYQFKVIGVYKEKANSTSEKME